MGSLVWVIRVIIFGAIAIAVARQLKGKTNYTSDKYQRIIKNKSSKLKHLKKYNSEFREQYDFADIPANVYLSKNIETETFDVDTVVKEIVEENKAEIKEVFEKINANEALWNKYLMGYNNIKMEEAEPIEDEKIDDTNMYITLEIQALARNRMPKPKTKAKFTFTILYPKGKTRQTEVVQCDDKQLKAKYYFE